MGCSGGWEAGSYALMPRCLRHIKAQQAQQAHVLLGPHVFKAQQAHNPIGVCLLCSMRCAFGLYFSTPSPGHSSTWQHGWWLARGLSRFATAMEAIHLLRRG